MIQYIDCTFVPEDYKTDSVIQSSLRHELGRDVTVITVAHRLQTIMDADKIVSHACISCLFHVIIRRIDGIGRWTHRVLSINPS